jgi:hypothetical protein
MSYKTVTMSCRDPDSGTTVEIVQKFSQDCNWPAVAYQFLCFLKAQGYFPDSEDVGADIESFVHATKDIKEEW